MTAIFQRTATDCLTAAIASVTDLPYEECPQLWDLPDGVWMSALQEWARFKGFGLMFMDLKDRKEWPILDGFHVIVGGSTPRSNKYGHAIVARAETECGQTKLHWIHDPKPNGDFIVDVHDIIALIKQ